MAHRASMRETERETKTKTKRDRESQRGSIYAVFADLYV